MADIKMMREKWHIAFKLMDFNKDGVVSVTDRDSCKQSFLDVYQLQDQLARDRMLAELDIVWDKSVFLNKSPDWSGTTYILDDFLASRTSAFQSDSAGAIASIQQAMTALSNAADVSGSGHFSFEDFKKLHVAFGLPDDKFIQTVFGAVGGDANSGCSCADVTQFYTELTMGQDTQKHATYLAVLATAGML